MDICQFVKFMGRNFSQYLTCPMELVMDIKKMGDVITLEGPSGNKWLVRLLESRGSVYLKEGWRQFVEAHHVEEGDCLAFEYRGSSCFCVRIFDKSGCEREVSYFVNSLQVISDDGNGSFKAKFNCRKNSCSSYSPMAKDEQELSTYSKKVERHSTNCDEVKKRLKAKVRFLHSTNAVHPETPYFTKYLLPSHVKEGCCLMIFPCEFAVKHLHVKPQTILLRHKGKLWPVEYKVRTASGRCIASGLYGPEWLSFARANELNVGDGCIFVLAESHRKKIFDIHIVPADDGLTCMDLIQFPLC